MCSSAVKNHLHKNYFSFKERSRTTKKPESFFEIPNAVCVNCMRQSYQSNEAENFFRCFECCFLSNFLFFFEFPKQRADMRTYNANVRIGNWYYDLILKEEKAKQFMRRSKNFELKVQKARKIFLSLLAEVPLTFPVVGLSYGAVIQIVSPEVPFEPIFKIKAKQGLALAADITFENIDKRDKFSFNDPVIGTGLQTPCVRNVWTLVPEDRSRQGKELRYGDVFQIQLYKSDPPLYVDAPRETPGTPVGQCGHVVPKLMPWTATSTRFRVVNVNRGLRFETEGQVVPPFQSVAIIQATSSESLAIEPESWFPTYFGMECEVSIHTYSNKLDKNKTDPRNFWSFILSAA